MSWERKGVRRHQFGRRKWWSGCHAHPSRHERDDPRLRYLPFPSAILRRSEARRSQLRRLRPRRSEHIRCRRGGKRKREQYNPDGDGAIAASDRPDTTDFCVDDLVGRVGGRTGTEWATILNGGDNERLAMALHRQFRALSPLASLVEMGEEESSRSEPLSHSP
jgi:hypothetical protein